MLMAMTAQAQKVTFYSPAFENAVRSHIGLGESEDVQQIHTDTITSLDLSGLGLTDIRDAVYLTAVTKLNLSYNNVSDLTPLLSLSELRELSLSNNQLENVNVLAFVQSEQLEVDVSNNNISDFSYFYTPIPCDLTFLGMGMQMEKDAPYFDVCQFYAEVDDYGRPVVSYRGYTNMAATMDIAGTQEPALFDGDTHEKAVTGSPGEAVAVTLSNGEKSEMTYVVTPQLLTVDAGQTIELATGLPDGYTLSSASALRGTVSVVGNTITYTAPDTKVPDIVNCVYYQGSTLKGFARYYLNVQKGDANFDGQVTITDAVAVVDDILGNTSSEFVRYAADVNNDANVTITDAVGVVDIILNAKE